MQVPKITCRFDDSLEGVIELRRVITLIVTVYYSERIQTKVSKGKSAYRVQETPSIFSQVSISRGVVWTGLSLTAVTGDSTYKVRPTRGAHVGLGV